jgi:NADPH2:quinone reductase
MNTNRRALRLRQFVEHPSRLPDALQVVEEPMPSPTPGEVVVRVEAAPCNPSDLIYLSGRYPAARPLPAIPGFEGAGTVDSAGGGALARLLVGKRVAFATAEGGDGSWCERAVVPAATCIPLPRGVSAEQGATMIVNPLSARAMVAEAAKCGDRALIVTACASQLGRQVIALARGRGIAVIGVVRRPEQVDELRAAGASEVLLDRPDDRESFESALAAAAVRYRARRALDAVGGDWPGRLLRAMGPGSTCVVYGALDERTDVTVDLLELLAGECKLEGFYLGRWLRRASWIERLKSVREVRRAFRTGLLTTQVAERTGLEGWPAALERYYGSMSRGKVLLRP